jgi:hypothetical protein
MEERADEYDQERRLDQEPPETLAARVQKGEAVWLEQRPHDARDGGHGADGGQDPGAYRLAPARLRSLGCDLRHLARWILLAFEDDFQDDFRVR